MDISDKNFKPCPCGYQICQFCYNNLRQNPQLVPKCPGCRRLYDDELVEYKSITPAEYRLQQAKREKKERERKQREKEKKELELANKKHLAGLRVVQKNLVYVTGLNPPCPPEDLHLVLRLDRYFGQYGKITKIVINKKLPSLGLQGHHHHSSSGLVVYVTFARKEDALRCINELDGLLCDGRVLRAAHGTTKYCSLYLRGHPCPNPNCMFLHEPGEEADSYTRKDLLTHQGIKMGMMGMNRSGLGSNLFGLSFGSDPDHHHQEPEEPVVALPATAHWATQDATLAASLPQVSNTPLANLAAFPTLSEIFKDQKHQQKKEAPKPKAKLRSNKENVLLPDDIDVDDDLAAHFLEENNAVLKKLHEDSQSLAGYFKNLEAPQGLPMFTFKPDLELGNPEEDKDRARLVIERFLFRPVKNYHLAYINHPITQLLHQQHQQQQRQQLTLQAAQLQQLHMEQQKGLQQQAHQAQQQAQQHQQAQQQQQAQHAQQAQQQQAQQQQQLLLLQLQQQAAKQQQQHAQQQAQQPLQQSQPQPQPQPQPQQPQPQPHQQQQQQQINMLRMNDRVQTSTPPPPGLFTGGAAALVPKQPQGVPLAQYQGQSFPDHSPTGGANQLTSSQLLSQLMGGKR